MMDDGKIPVTTCGKKLYICLQAQTFNLKLAILHCGVLPLTFANRVSFYSAYQANRLKETIAQLHVERAEQLLLL